jgi:ABC-type transport system substrate-binding protein
LNNLPQQTLLFASYQRQRRCNAIRAEVTVEEKPMRFRLIGQFAALLAAQFLITSSLDARPIRWARSQDALTLDPDAQNEGPTHNMLHMIYEPLIDRDTRDGSLIPTLALSWNVTNDPTAWEFKLRPNVRFHNGNMFNADAAVFSFARAPPCAVLSPFPVVGTALPLTPEIPPETSLIW